MEFWRRYRWGGNLRELGNLVKRYLVLEDEKLVVEELRAKCQDDCDGQGESTFSLPPTGKGLKALVRTLKDEAEARQIQRVLESTSRHRNLATAHLTIAYTSSPYT